MRGGGSIKDRPQASAESENDTWVIPGSLIRASYCSVLSSDDRRVAMAEQHSAPDPTSVTNEYVVTVHGPPEVTSAQAERYGKWLVFRDVQLLDETWHVIEKAVESGELGAMEASCSTRKYNPSETGPGSKQSGVIRVFTTEDTMDEVGFRLAQLVKHDISYKTEEATRKGMYVHSGARKTTLKTIYWNRGAPSFALMGKPFSWKVATLPEATEGGEKSSRGLMRDFWSQNIARAPIDRDGSSEKINGKWVLHVDHRKMSDVWHIIKDEIESGKLSALEAECPPLSIGRGGHRGARRGRGGIGRGWGRTGRGADGKRFSSEVEVTQNVQAQSESQEEKGKEDDKQQHEFQPQASRGAIETEESSADVVEHKEPKKMSVSEEAHGDQPQTVTASEGQSADSKEERRQEFEPPNEAEEVSADVEHKEPEKTGDSGEAHGDQTLASEGQSADKEEGKQEFQPSDHQQQVSRGAIETEESSADVEHKEPEKKGESGEAPGDQTLASEGQSAESKEEGRQPQTVTASEGQSARSEEEESADHSSVRETPAEIQPQEPTDETAEHEQHQQKGQVDELELQSEEATREHKHDKTDRPQREEGGVMTAADTKRESGEREGESETSHRDQETEAAENQHEHPSRQEGSFRTAEDEEQIKQRDRASEQDHDTQQKDHLRMGDKDTGKNGTHHGGQQNDTPQGDGRDERGHDVRLEEVPVARAQEENRDEDQREGRLRGSREQHQHGRQPGQWRAPHQQGSGQGRWEKRREEGRWGASKQREKEKQGPWRRSQPGKWQTPRGRDQGGYGSTGGAHQGERHGRWEDRGEGRPRAAIVVYTSDTKMEEVGRRLIELVEGDIRYETRETATSDGRLVPSRQRVLHWNNGEPVFEPSTQS